MKKKLILLCVLALLVMSLAVSANAALTEETGEHVLSLSVDKTSVKLGETVAVTVSVTKNTGASLIAAAIDYDTALFEIADESAYEAEGKASTIFGASQGGAFTFQSTDKSFGWYSSSGDTTTATGVLFTVTFTAVDDVENVGETAEFRVKTALDSGSPADGFFMSGTENQFAYYPPVYPSPVSVSVTHDHAPKDSNEGSGHFARVEKKCFEDGNIEYWVCSCGQKFSDASCTEKVEDGDIAILHSHELTKVEEKESSCSQKAEPGNIEYYHCSGDCGKDYATNDDQAASGSELSSVTKEYREHKDIFADDESCHHGETESTCLVKGNIEFWQCPYCEVAYTDAQGGSSTTTFEKDLKAHGAQGYEFVAEVPATMQAAGVKQHWVCKVCYSEDNITEEGVNNNVYFNSEAGGEAQTDWSLLEIERLKCLPGDVNNDGIVARTDAMLLIRNQMVGDNTLPVKINCDVNGDGSVARTDAMLLIRNQMVGDNTLATAAAVQAKWDELGLDPITGLKAGE